MDEVDSILRDGGNSKNSILRIAAFFAKNLSLEDNADFLRREYLSGRWEHNARPGGKGYQFGTRQTSVWFDDKGITIGRGKSAVYSNDSATLTWEQAAGRIRELYNAGMYVSHDTLEEALYNESREVAEDIIEVYSNMSRGLSDIRYELRSKMNEAQKQATKDDWKNHRRYLIHGLSELDNRANAVINSEIEATPDEIMALYEETLDIGEEIPAEWQFQKVHPDIDERMTELLRDKGEIGDSEISRGVGYNEQSEYALILNRLSEDVTALAEESAVPIRFWRNPYTTLDRLEKSGLPPHGFPVAEYQPLNYMRFITDDEVDMFLARGGSYSEGKLRFLSHFLNEHTPKERVDFVKKEYGYGGGTWVGGGWHEAVPGKGIILKRPGCNDVNFNWNQVTQRTQALVNSGRFATRRDLDRIQDYEKLILARSINNFFYNLPEEYERPFDRALDFNNPRNDEWTALTELLADTERIETLITQMQHIYTNTPADDRHYSYRQQGFLLLAEYQEGTYNLFPGLENLPSPEDDRTLSLPEIRGRQVIEQSQASGQLSLFDLEQTPVLPDAEAQREKIEQASKQKEVDEQLQQVPSAELGNLEVNENEITPQPISQDEIDGLLLSISDIDKELLAAQLAINPRSRESVTLVREIYGSIYETIALAWPALIKRITELSEMGYFAVEVPESPEVEQQEATAGQVTDNSPTLYEEYLQVKLQYPDSIVIFQMGDFYEFCNEDADIVSRELGIALASRSVPGQTERIKMVSVPLHSLSNCIDTLFTAGYNLAMSVTDFEGKRSVTYIPQEDSPAIDDPTVDESAINEPVVKETPPPIQEVAQEPVSLDFDAVAQTVLGRIMQDTEFVEALYEVQGRGAIRRPLNTTLDVVIDEHQEDEPHVYHAYYNDDDFNDDLFGFVYRGAWEFRQQGEQVEINSVQETDAQEIPQHQQDVFTEQPRYTAPPNFRITDDHLGEGGAKTKYRYNLDAIRTLKDLEFEKRPATPEEQQILSRYVGWGGIQQAFDPDNNQWTKEYFELRAALSPDEYRLAKRSVLNAHYTTPTVIKAIYDTVERLGFKTGNILEPSCGIGNFFGLLPESMEASKLYGVELDSISAQIAKHLYPKANIQESGFEKTQMPDAFFDVAIGNVPFGGYSVHDKRYNKHKFQIHDYFIAKSLDQVRPGGIIAFVTSKGTLDKVTPDTRKYLAQKADLLGAVRLPNNAFLKNAGTQATTDIIFLQKRERPIDIEPDWVQLGYTEDGLPINRYFADNPEMVLGKMSNDNGVRMYGSENSTTCLPIEGADLAEQLRAALLNIHGKITDVELDDMEGVDNHAIPADPRVRNFSYALVIPDIEGGLNTESVTEGQVYFRENSLMYPVDLPVNTLERIKGMVAIRDCTHELIALQVDEHGEDEIVTKQAELNTLYDAYTAEFGLINSIANNRAFSADNSYYLLSSLEILDEDNNLERKADMFSQRTIKPQVLITRVDTASEALAVSLSEKGYVDLGYMESLSGFDREKLISDLKGVIFLNIGNAGDQTKTYVTSDEYLSGNIRDKLALAKAAQKTVSDSSVDINVTSLEAVLPKALEAQEITVRLGSTWIDKEYVQQFIRDLLPASKVHSKDYQVNYSPRTGEWQVSGRGKALYSDINATVTYGM